MRTHAALWAGCLTALLFLDGGGFGGGGVRAAAETGATSAADDDDGVHDGYSDPVGDEAPHYAYAEDGLEDGEEYAEDSETGEELPRLEMTAYTLEPRKIMLPHTGTAEVIVTRKLHAFCPPPRTTGGTVAYGWIKCGC
jgi:hypothetical protein